MSSVKSSHNHSFIQENLFVGLRIKMNKGFLPGDKKFNPFQRCSHVIKLSFHSALMEFSEFQYGLQNYRGFGETPLISFPKITITLSTIRGYRVDFKSEQIIEPAGLNSGLKSQIWQ